MQKAGNTFADSFPVTVPEGVKIIHPTGVGIGLTVLPSDLGVTTQNFIGRSQFAADAYYTGSVDEVRIYNRALSRPEVLFLIGK